MRSGRPREKRTSASVKAVAENIRRNPLRKQKLAREMKIASRTMSRIIKVNLKLGAYRQITGQKLTETLHHIRAIRNKKLLQQYANGGYVKTQFEIDRRIL